MVSPYALLMQHCVMDDAYDAERRDFVPR